MLSELTRDAYDSGINEITITIVDELLKRPKYHFLEQNRTDRIELRDGELAWFSPNSKYSIGLRKDGTKPWIVSGKRAED
ncbi:MAG: hypothetical protein ABL888_22550 [Pirellulaceae bacterium]